MPAPDDFEFRIQHHIEEVEGAALVVGNVYRERPVSVYVHYGRGVAGLDADLRHVGGKLDHVEIVGSGVCVLAQTKTQTL